MKPVLQVINMDTDRMRESGMPDYTFWCPGCSEQHGVWTRKANSMQARWDFNGNLEKPTFSPSLLIRGVQPITEDERVRILSGEIIEPKPYCCHTFIRDGQIQYLGDCTHHLAGQTVPMEPEPE